VRTIGASVRMALGALRAHLLRTALTMLGIIIGVGAVIAMVSVGAGAQRRISEQIRSLGSNAIVVMSGASTSGGIRWGLGTQLTLTEEDARAIAVEVPAIEVAAPSVRGAAQTVFGNTNWSTVIQGVTPDYLVAREWAVGNGKMFGPEDVDSAAKVAVLGETVWTSLFGDTDPVGQTIRIKKVPFTVVGVLEAKGQSSFGQDQDDVILIPISTAKKKVLGRLTQSNPRSVQAVNVRVKEADLMVEAEDQIRDLLRQRHRLQPGQDDDFQIRVLAELFAAQEESARVMTMLLAAIASVSLLVGGIGIMNIMLVSVTERTREIGLRMAVGARSRDILAQFLIEAVTLAIAGGVVGIASGLVGAQAIASFAGWTTDVPPEAIALAFVFSGAVGVFFGFYPARKASRLDPIDALRYE
jgi:putative ABC transport system permease protein